MKPIHLASVLVLSLSSCTTTGLGAAGLASVGGQALNWIRNNLKPGTSTSSAIEGEWTALASPYKFNFQSATNGYYLVTGSDKAQSFVWNRTGQVVNVSALGGRTFVFSLVNGKLKGAVDDKEVVLVKSDS